MITVQDILNFLETIAPASLKAEWDNVGLLCGRPEKEVQTILVALDPFPHVCQEAISLSADLLLTHHPLIFTPLKSVTGDAVLCLAENGIAAVNAHTNLDCAEGGVNDVLAEKLGLQSIQVINLEERLLRKGIITPQNLQDFLSHIKNALGCDKLRYVSGCSTVCRVAVGGGSCADYLQEVKDSGCDTFVTADVKYNQFWQAKELGINLIDATHFATENPVCAVLAEKLQNAFPELQVVVSKDHADCMKFF